MLTNLYINITKEAMMSDLGHNPRSFQHNLIPHIISIKNGSENYAFYIVNTRAWGLKVIGTSNYQCHQRHYSISFDIIENTLALSSDQLSKINKISAVSTFV
jgi:hypothetical protein